MSTDLTTYRVGGMTCDHCARAVTEEVGRVPEVTAVEVDVDAGTVVVAGSGFTEESIAAAVDEAGYSFGGPSR